MGNLNIKSQLRIKILFLLGILFLNSCNNSREKVTTVFSEDGKILEVRVFSNSEDTLDYLLYHYFKNGNIKSISPYENGLLNGRVLDYYENGNLHIITNYLADTVFGVNQVFSEDGELIRKSLYIDGQQMLFEQLFINRDLNMKKMDLYEVAKEKADIVGQIVYENGKIKKDWSLYCFTTMADTLILNKEYAVTLEGLTKWKDAYLEADVFHLNKNFRRIDSTKSIKVANESLNIKFMLKPSVLGYNFVFGTAYIKKDTMISCESNTLTLIVPFYRDYFVTEE